MTADYRSMASGIARFFHSRSALVPPPKRSALALSSEALVAGATSGFALGFVGPFCSPPAHVSAPSDLRQRHTLWIIILLQKCRYADFSTCNLRADLHLPSAAISAALLRPKTRRASPLLRRTSHGRLASLVNTTLVHGPPATASAVSATLGRGARCRPRASPLR